MSIFHLFIHLPPSRISLILSTKHCYRTSTPTASKERIENTATLIETTTVPLVIITPGINLIDGSTAAISALLIILVISLLILLVECHIKIIQMDKLFCDHWIIRLVVHIAQYYLIPGGHRLKITLYS